MYRITGNIGEEMHVFRFVGLAVLHCKNRFVKMTY